MDNVLIAAKEQHVDVGVRTKGVTHEQFDRVAARYPPRLVDIVLPEQRHYLQRRQRLPPSEVTHPLSIADLGVAST